MAGYQEHFQNSTDLTSWSCWVDLGDRPGWGQCHYINSWILLGLAAWQLWSLGWHAWLACFGGCRDAVLEQWLEATQRTIEGNRSHRTLIWLEVGIGQDTRFEKHYHGGTHIRKGLIRKGLKPREIGKHNEHFGCNMSKLETSKPFKPTKEAELIMQVLCFPLVHPASLKKNSIPLPAPRLRLRAHPCHLRLMVGAPIHIWTGKFLWRDGLYLLDMFLDMV